MTCVNRILAVALAALPSLALAQPSSGQASVAAETLFREGKKLMQDGKLAEACDKLAASDRIEASVGTLLNLADCREKNGQLATAWATFLRAASLARTNGDTSRETEAHRRASVLEPQLAYLTISVPQASLVDNLVIKRNDEAIDRALWNQGVPVDVGTYEVSGQAPGHEPWSTRVQVTANGSRTSVEVPRFKQLKDLAPATATPAATTPEQHDGDDDESHPVASSPGLFSTQRIAALATAGVGFAGIAGGIAFGLEANSLESQANAICPMSACADSHALDLNHRAHNDALISNIAFGVGGAAIVTGAVLWLLGAPDQTAEHVGVVPVVGKGVAGLAFGRSF